MKAPSNSTGATRRFRKTELSPIQQLARQLAHQVVPALLAHVSGQPASPEAASMPAAH